MSKPFKRTEEVVRENYDPSAAPVRRRVTYKVRGYWSEKMVSVSQDRNWSNNAWDRAEINYCLGARVGEVSEITAVRSLAAALADAANVVAKWNREKYPESTP